MEQRIRRLNPLDLRPGGEYVLYWMRWNRRVESNHALAFAAELANRMDLPLLVLETWDCASAYAAGRRHEFVVQGVAETARRLRKLGAGYQFVSSKQGSEEQQVLREMARKAAAVVTDDYPAPIAGPSIDCPVQAFAVDSSCIVPMSLIESRSYAAYSIRPKIHQLLPQFLKPVPAVKLRRRLAGDAAHLPVAPASSAALFRGGRLEAERLLQQFLDHRLPRYASEKNEPSAHATSDLSPYLHFGHISSLEVALAVHDYGAQHKLIADEFLEELIVRRELAFNFVRYAQRVDSLAELPEWARATLDRHRADRRDPVYSREQLESAATYDELWNATQKELVLRGKIHGYYRMYWGKKIIEWSATPEEALAAMIYFHDRYALDGQDPNTYANILWCFGLHDRPWTERPIFGTIRWMSRAGMERKTGVQAYLSEIDCLERTGRWGGAGGSPALSPSSRVGGKPSNPRSDKVSEPPPTRALASTRERKQTDKEHHT